MVGNLMMLERRIYDVARREGVIGHFPNMQSKLRLLASYLMEREEDWSSRRKDFNMAGYWKYKECFSSQSTAR